MIRKVKNVQKLEFLRILGVLMMFFSLNLNMTLFWNPWDQGSTQEVFLGFLYTIRIIRKVKNVQKLGFWRVFGVLIRFLSLKLNI